MTQQLTNPLMLLLYSDRYIIVGTAPNGTLRTFFGISPAGEVMTNPAIEGSPVFSSEEGGKHINNLNNNVYSGPAGKGSYDLIRDLAETEDQYLSEDPKSAPVKQRSIIIIEEHNVSFTELIGSKISGRLSDVDGEVIITGSDKDQITMKLKQTIKNSNACGLNMLNIDEEV